MSEWDPIITAYSKARAIAALGEGEGGDVSEDDPLMSEPATGEERSWLHQLVDKLDGYQKKAEAWIQSRLAESKARAKALAKAVVDTAEAMDRAISSHAGRPHRLPLTGPRCGR